ncbi:glutamine synthetase family protein [Streptantibioticus parmotrematis]|uniref:glutamine synthetase family protein n=1 Tax=Streptantibioticus parmotrematis TaxID=2873249 RepID=UPI0033E58AD3
MGAGAEERTAREELRRRARQEAARLTAEGVHAVALSWVDTSGVARVKAVPTGRLAHAARHGVGASPVFDVFTSDDAITASPLSGGPDGDLRLVPDLDRLTVLAAQPGWAWVPADRQDQSGVPHPGCARHFLRRMTAAARDSGFEPRMGYETEWVVCRPGDDEPPVAAGAGPAYGMSRLVEMSDYLRDVVTALRDQELEVLQIHPEYSPGQFEVSTAPADPLRAADELLVVRETIRAVTQRHGLRATFAPTVVAGGVGNGCHLHLSLRQDDQDLFRGGPGPQGLTETAEGFLAGILDELPALLAVGAPSPASYLRLAPSVWAGAYHCWGLENREAALRLIPGPPDESGSANAEVKCFDAAANPYLLAGAVLAAGLAGAGAKRSLPAPVQGDPAVVAPATPRLPRSLTQAADRFAASEVLRAALGETLHGAVLAVRRAEAESLDGRDPEAVAAATRWRY